MCCPGCQAVATAIVAGGLDSYYRYRTEPAQQADVADILRAEYLLYDRNDLQQSFIRDLPDGNKEVRLLIEGITCSACIWLLEHHLSSIAGVKHVTVNLSQHTATITYHPESTKVSDLMLAVLSVGYKAHPWRQDKQEALLEKENKQFIRRLAVAGIGTMQVMMYAIALYTGADEHYRTLIRWVSALLATPVVFYSAQPFFQAAWRDLRNKRPGMDVPVSIAIGGAYIASLWATLQGNGEIYFDSVSMFTFFLLSGRYLEMRARYKTSHSSRSLQSLLPESCLKINAEGETERTVPADLQPGDHIRVMPGDSIPADGRVISGTSPVNESALTGEHMPVSRTIGDHVTAGTLNTENALDIEVTRTGQNTRLAAISRLLEQAQSDKPAIARIADRVAGWFVGAVLLTAVGVYYYWFQHEPEHALWIVLSVLVATCPCALSLATPTALTTVTGYLQSKGFLISKGHVLEGLPQITHVIFDKTGTLTKGELSIQQVQVLDTSRTEAELLALAAGLEAHSEHPIASAFPESSIAFTDVRNVTGQGLEGQLDGQVWRIGKPDFAVPEQTPALPDSNHTWLLLSCDNMSLAWFALDDTLRPEATAVVQQLIDRGLRVELLSGDNQGVADRIGQQAGITVCTGQATPDDKLERVRALQSEGARVMMVGDGVNDIPVLAAANISVAMNTASDLARTHADALLLSGDLRQLPEGFEKAVQTRRNIRQNMGWALGYNLLVLPLAASGWLAPWMAAIGMSASSLIVVGNALRLAKVRSSEGEHQHG
ncbi:heavy metal translocating P-type ATPase [Parendozoicomonas haliclonae]|uniref:P-type Cu(2+) transporter n=2 Tax=Parendozoicomonas haliclonae TaxID=1960125 RepID=A0A1X7AHU0_9GAMM|nr:Copper-exporting P-type ATPase A [Parendozoicomonas haliclonae]